MSKSIIICNDLKIINSWFLFALNLWKTYIYRLIYEFIAFIQFSNLSNWQTWQITKLVFSAVTSWQDRYMTLKVNLVLGTWKWLAIWKIWLWSFCSLNADTKYWPLFCLKTVLTNHKTYLNPNSKLGFFITAVIEISIKWNKTDKTQISKKFGILSSKWISFLLRF